MHVRRQTYKQHSGKRLGGSSHPVCAFPLILGIILLFHTILHIYVSFLERFSIECRKTKTRVITLANHKGHR